ncbi:hypothetical protein M6B38_412845 [Iris pallida]|uniref:Uncharacterized protein n=1 Tax=Iris pallida TaxID=29817 RepID=A0AAX6FMC4_IRIPA|nr:hypothetical protein M6B38_412845 [Iris pallida]
MHINLLTRSQYCSLTLHCTLFLCPLSPRLSATSHRRCPTLLLIVVRHRSSHLAGCFCPAARMKTTIITGRHRPPSVTSVRRRALFSTSDPPWGTRSPSLTGLASPELPLIDVPATDLTRIDRSEPFMSSETLNVTTMTAAPPWEPGCPFEVRADLSETEESSSSTSPPTPPRRGFIEPGSGLRRHMATRSTDLSSSSYVALVCWTAVSDRPPPVSALREAGHHSRSGPSSVPTSPAEPPCSAAR